MEKDNEAEHKEELKRLHNVLNKIFYSNQLYDYCGIIKTTEAIPYLLDTLFLIKDFSNKLYIIDLFSKLFSESPGLIHIFNNFDLYIANSPSLILLEIFLGFYYSSFDISVTDDLMALMQTKTIELLNTVMTNSDLSHKVADFIFRRIACNDYMHSEGGKRDGMAELRRLTEFKSTVQLLQVIYEGNGKKAIPNNYLFFTGSGWLDVNLKGVNLALEQSKLEFWFYCEYDCSGSLKECGLKECRLVHIENSNKQLIEVVLTTNYIVQMQCGNHKKAIESIVPNKWYKVVLSFKSVLFKDPVYSIRVFPSNLEERQSQANVSKERDEKELAKTDSLPAFNIKHPITKMIFYDDFVGRAGSIALFCNTTESSEYLSLPFGLYKDKILKEIIHQHYSLFFKNTTMNAPIIRETTKTLSQSIKKPIVIKEALSMLKFLFVPFHYEEKTHSLDDTVSHLTASFKAFSAFSNGVVLNKKQQKKIQTGFFELLPVIEKLYLLIISSKADCDDSTSSISHGLFKDILIQYLKLMLITINQRSNSKMKNSHIASKVQTKTFFSVFSLFLTKLPKYLFTLEVLEAFFILADQPDNYDMQKRFYQQVLLNEIIIFKFTTESQIKLWEFLFPIILSKQNHAELMDLARICLILKTYDDTRYEEFCCRKHKNLFAFPLSSKYNNNRQEMQPNLLVSLSYFHQIVLHVINHNASSDERNKAPNATLFKLLALDLSPCMQIFILEIFLEHLRDGDIEKEQKTLTFKNILDNNGIDIIQYLMSVSLVDVKVVLIQLLWLLLKNYRNMFYVHFARDQTKLAMFFGFLKENITMEYIEIEKEEKSIVNDNLLKDNSSNVIINGENAKKEEPMKIIGYDPKELKPVKFICTSPIKRPRFSSSYLQIDQKKVANEDKDGKHPEMKVIEPKHNRSSYLNRSSSQKSIHKRNKKPVFEGKHSLIIEQGPMDIDKSDIRPSVYSNRETITNDYDDFMQIEIVKYQRIKLPSNRQYISHYFNRDLYKEHLRELLSTLIQWLTQLLQETEHKKTVKPQPSQKTQSSQSFKMKPTELLSLKNMIASFVIDLMIKVSAHSRDNDIISLFITYMTYVLNTIEKQGTQEQPQKKHKDLPDSFLLTTKANSSLIFENNQLLFHWVIEVCFQFYLAKKVKDYKASIAGISSVKEEISIRRDCQFIIESLFFEDASFQNIIALNEKENKLYDKFNFILTWGVYQKSIYANDQDVLPQITVFLHLLIKAIIYKYNESLIILNKAAQNENVYWSFLSLSFLLYEYLLLYNNNKKIFKNFKVYGSISSDQSIIPFYLFEGISKTGTESFGKIEYLWLDYKTFDLIYRNLKPLWSYRVRILKAAGYQIDLRDSKVKMEITKMQIELIIEQLIFSKKNKDVIEVHELLSPCDRKPKEDQVPLIIIISNLLAITLSLMLDNDKEEAKQWIEEYKEFLLFCIVASCNMTNGTTSYAESQSYFYNVLLFGFSFLLEMSFVGKYERDYQDALVTITYFISQIILEKKAKDKAFAIKAKQLEIGHSAVFLFYQNFVLVEGNEENDLWPQEKMEAFTSKQNEINHEAVLKFLKELYDANKWATALIKSKKLAKARQFLFNEALIEKICRRRYQEISCIIPFFKVKHGKLPAEEEVALKFSPNYVPIDYLEARTRLQESLRALVPYLLKQLHDNHTYSSYMKTIRLYKKIKKELFSWVGCWSNKQLFFVNDNTTDANSASNNLLKLKVMNHYTKDFTTPLLKPILDINHYLPLFSLFNPGLIFIQSKGDALLQSNTVKSDANALLSDSTEVQEEGEESFYLKSLYKCAYSDVARESYALNVNISNDKHLFLNLKRLEYFNEEKEGYICCLVKSTHHIKGKLSFMQKKIKFTIPFTPPTDYTLINYDNERKACFGSFFSSHKPNEDHSCLSIYFNNISMILFRSYFYQKIGLEIFTSSNKSYLLLFSSEKKRRKVLMKFQTVLELEAITSDMDNDGLIGYENRDTQKNAPSEVMSLRSVIGQWKNWKISTLDFLMKLNLFANRSYRDLNQYPVFPWIVTNFTEPKLKFPEDLRPLHLPIGMLAHNERSKKRSIAYTEQFEGMKMENSEDLMYYGDEISGICNFDNAPYCFGSHYSNVVYVSHYMMRLFPFSSISIELQGAAFDHPNRLFLSLESTFESASTQKTDVRELCPQFFFLPEMFKNLNKLNFGSTKKTNNTSYQIMDVHLPQWANDNPVDFIANFRKILEVDCSSTIHLWIDLIFGSKQRGRKADKNNNLFLPYSYDYSIDFAKITDKDKILCIMRLLEMGMTPSQVTTNDLDERRPRPQTSFIDHDRPLKFIKFPFAFSMPFYIKVVNENTLYLVSRNYQIDIIPFIQNNDRESVKIKNAILFSTMPKEHRSPITLEVKSCYIGNSNQSVVIYGNGACLAQGGFWDGRILLSELETKKTKFFYCLFDQSPVNVIKLNKKETTAYCGSKSGSLIVYTVEKLKWTYSSKKNDHKKEVIAICCNEALNILASSSIDGYVMLYTLPKVTNFRVIKMVEPFADHVFLSASPVPSVVLYSHNYSNFSCFSINGSFYKEVHEYSGQESNKQMLNVPLYSPKVITDSSFFDYLLYGTTQGELICRKFPSMEIVSREVLFDKTPLYLIEVNDSQKCIFALSGKDIKVWFNKKLLN